MKHLTWGNPSGWQDYAEDTFLDDDEGVAADAAILQARLNGMGFDADAADIRRAYAEWSEEEYCAGWLSLSGMNIDGVLAVLISKAYLKPASP